MKTAILLLFLVGLSCAQLPTDDTRPTPDGTRPDGTTTRPTPDGTRPPVVTRPPLLVPDPDSVCGVEDRTCPDGTLCVKRRTDVNTLINECDTRPSQNEGCMRRDFVEGDNDDKRLSASVTGALERPVCEDGLICMDDLCIMREGGQSMCEMQRVENMIVSCEENGMFQPLQCRRTDVRRDEDGRPLPTAVNCYCANRTDGRAIENTRRLNITRREDAPDCASRSYRSCRAMRDGQMIAVRHEESVLELRGEQCMNCRCNDGSLNCRDSSGCRRTDRNCIMQDGETVMNGQQRQDGKCNMCSCRDGTLHCTTIDACKGEDNDADRSEEDRGCQACMNTDNGPTCSLVDGRTFPTRCHALMCQDLNVNEIAQGPCSERNACESDQRCGADFSCLRRGGETRMSREGASPDDRRLCVDRRELRCLPTVMVSGGRRIEEDRPDEDPFQGLQRDQESDDDEEDRTVCASDGNSYPSTCHMMTESRGDMLPRVRHAGVCEDEGTDEMRIMKMVCATDGVTYDDVRTMRTIGSDVRMDYMGRCDDPDSTDDDTPADRCMVARDQRCPSLEGCTRIVMPSDGCCRVCGSAVVMAIDQDAMDEHVRNTGELQSIDEFGAGFYHDDGEREPLISNMAPRRCNITITRPTTGRDSNVEVLFEAKNKSTDANYCHEQAMRMAMRVNDNMQTQTSEESFIAAAVVAPEVTVTDPSGAPAFVAPLGVLLAASLVALFL